MNSQTISEEMFTNLLAESVFPRLRHLLPLFVLILAASCAGGEKDNDDTGTAADSTRGAYINGQQTPFHADNDIAMVVRSMVDAMTVGEKFTPEAYDFSAVLTDGAGAPLYIDSVGNPGMWQVKVIGPDKATVSNVNDGDLVASELADYVSSCLGLSDANVSDAIKEEDGEMRVYQLETGHLVFESPGEEGLEGCHVTVTVTEQFNHKD